MPRPLQYLSKKGVFGPLSFTPQGNARMSARHRFRRTLRNLSILLAVLVSSIVSSDAESAFTKGTDPLLVINLMSFDASNGDINARLQLKLPESEITPKFSPKHDYFLVDELTVNESILKIDASNSYSAFNNVLHTQYQVHDAGAQFLYPFDDHKAHLRIFVDRNRKTNGDGFVEERLPVKVDTSLCSFEGYKITLTPGPDNSPTYVDLQIELQRTRTIQIFTMFVSLLMLAVAIGFMNMVRKFLKSNAAPDIQEMAFGAALLFAFPAIRSIEPFVPPMGVLSDFVGFFCAETIVAIALIIHLYSWMKRKSYDT